MGMERDAARMGEGERTMFAVVNDGKKGAESHCEPGPECVEGERCVRDGFGEMEEWGGYWIREFGGVLGRMNCCLIASVDDFYNFCPNQRYA